jgi:dipeptidyl aminopeptidase/acylaminoacyl peptidase
MPSRWYVAAGLICIAMTCRGARAVPFDAATAFGARPSASALQMSPDGMSVVYIAPTKGQGSIAYTLSLAKGSTPKPALAVDGKPFRLSSCHWVSNDRIVCLIYAVEHPDPTLRMVTLSRTVAVDADGKNVRILSTRQNQYSRGYAFGGGSVIDWLPDENGAVLMTRVYIPDDHVGSHLGSSSEGLGVDWIDTRTLSVKHVEPARREAVGYITDGRGTVRIMGTRQTRAEQETGTIIFLYRLAGSRDWHTLGDYNEVDRSGFYPEAVDHDRNVAYGYKRKDGHVALYSVTLDEARHEELVFEHPDVDASGLVYIGRNNRVVGTSYATDISRVSYFASDVRSMVVSLAKALPNHLIDVVDSSLDQSRMLIFSSSDVDAGAYYIFDRSAHQLQTFLVTRAQIEGQKLAHVKPITYPASDGTPIPAYLTLPPGKEDAKNLPAIVLPHGGPSARDEWGFDWLPQFFAARGFAVLQPNFRGSSGYGDAWFEKNGFRSWPIAIGDVSDGGRWLVREGIADPSRLAIVGWSYGGYAALQSAVVDPALFKAVVAIAPVTDLAALKEEHRYWSNFDLVSDYIGEGPHMHEGSPIEQAARIKAPVLLFHGGLDANVSIQQSRHMAARLRSAGASCELVTWDELDHYLEDSDARAQMLRKSDEFLRKALGM